jgi:uncharacterized protein
MDNRALTLINVLELSPHPEGGYYKEMYRSETTVHSSHAEAMRNGLTDIYFLLISGQISRFHRVLHDEIWHLYEGAPLVIVEIEANGLEMCEVRLEGHGPLPKFKHCVKGGNWQAAYSTGEYTLVGCTVAPGFDFTDFTFLSQEAELQSTVLEKFPMIGHLL